MSHASCCYPCIIRPWSIIVCISCFSSIVQSCDAHGLSLMLSHLASVGLQSSQQLAGNLLSRLCMWPSSIAFPSTARPCPLKAARAGVKSAQCGHRSLQHASVWLDLPYFLYRDPAAVVHLAKKFADLDAIPAIKTHFLGKSIFTAKDEEALLSLLDDADDSVAKALIALLLDRAVCKLEVSSTCTLPWKSDQTSPAQVGVGRGFCYGGSSSEQTAWLLKKGCLSSGGGLNVLGSCGGSAQVPSMVQFGSSWRVALPDWMRLLHAVVLRHSAKGCRAFAGAGCLVVSGAQAGGDLELLGSGSAELACCPDSDDVHCEPEGQGLTSNSSLAGFSVYAMHLECCMRRFKQTCCLLRTPARSTRARAEHVAELQQHALGAHHHGLP